MVSFLLKRDRLNMVVSWECSIVETFFRIHLRPTRPFMVYNCSENAEIPISRILMKLSRQNLPERRDATKPQPQPAMGGGIWKIFALAKQFYSLEMSYKSQMNHTKCIFNTALSAQLPCLAGLFKPWVFKYSCSSILFLTF